MVFEKIAIAIAASGLIILSTHPYKFYSLHLFDSQFIYLRATECGTCVYLGVTIFLRTLIFLTQKLNQAALFKHITPFIYPKLTDPDLQADATLVLCFASAFLWGKCANKLLLWDSKVWEKQVGSSVPHLLMLIESLRNASIDKLLVDATIDQHPLLFTLKSEQIYVGFPIALQAPSERDGPNQELIIQPVLRGNQHISGNQNKRFLEPVSMTPSSPSANLVLLRREEISQLKPVLDLKSFLLHHNKLRSEKSSTETADSICPTK